MDEDERLELNIGVDSSELITGMNRAVDEVDSAIEGMVKNYTKNLNEIKKASGVVTSEVKKSGINSIQDVMDVMGKTPKEAQAIWEDMLKRQVASLEKEVKSIQLTENKKLAIIQKGKKEQIVTEEEYVAKKEALAIKQLQLQELLDVKKATSVAKEKQAAEDIQRILNAASTDTTAKAKVEAAKQEVIETNKTKVLERESKKRAKIAAQEKAKSVETPTVYEAGSSTIKTTSRQVPNVTPKIETEGTAHYLSKYGGAQAKFHSNDWSNVKTGTTGMFKDDTGWASSDPKQGGTTGFSATTHRSVDNSNTTRLERRMVLLRARNNAQKVKEKELIKVDYDKYKADLVNYQKYLTEGGFKPTNVTGKDGKSIGQYYRNDDLEGAKSFNQWRQIPGNAKDPSPFPKRIPRDPTTAGGSDYNERTWQDEQSALSLESEVAADNAKKVAAKKVKAQAKNERDIIKKQQELLDAAKALSGLPVSELSKLNNNAANLEVTAGKVKGTGAVPNASSSNDVNAKMNTLVNAMQRLMNVMTENRVGDYYDNQNKSGVPPKSKKVSTLAESKKFISNATKYSGSEEEFNNKVAPLAHALDNLKKAVTPEEIAKAKNDFTNVVRDMVVDTRSLDNIAKEIAVSSSKVAEKTAPKDATGRPMTPEQEAAARTKASTKIIEDAFKTCKSLEEFNGAVAKADAVLSGTLAVPDQNKLAYNNASSLAGQVNAGNVRLPGMIAAEKKANEPTKLPTAEELNPLKDYSGALGAISRTFDTLKIKSKAFFDGTNHDAEASAKNISGYFKSVTRIASGILISQGFYMLVNGITQGVSSLAKFVTTMEQTNVAFTQMLGNGKAATSMLNGLEDLAAKTPYEIDDSIANAKKMMGYGFKSNEIVPKLTTMQDAASLNGNDPVKLDNIVTAIGKVKATGKLNMRTIQSLAASGVNATEILQNNLEVDGGAGGVVTQGTGKKKKQSVSLAKDTTKSHMSNEQLHALISSGSINSEVAIDAIMQGLDKKYGGLAAKLNQTTMGLISNIHDSIMMIGEQMLKGLNKSTGGLIKGMADSLGKIREASRKFGGGGAFEAIVSPQYQNTVRTIIGYLGSMGRSIKSILGSAGSLKYMLGGFATGMKFALIPIIGLLKAVSTTLTALNKHTPAVKLLMSALGAIIAISMLKATAFWVMTLGVKLGGLLKLGTIVRNAGLLMAAGFNCITGGAVGATAATTGLGVAMDFLLANPIVLVIVAIGAALILVCKYAKDLKKALFNAFGDNGITRAIGSVLDYISAIYDVMAKVVGKIGSLFSDIFGVDTSSILQPEDVEDTDGALAGNTEALNDEADAANAATAANKLFAASFDELHLIDDNGDDGSGGDGSGGSGAGTGAGKGGSTIGKGKGSGGKDTGVKWPDIPPIIVPPIPPTKWPPMDFTNLAFDAVHVLAVVSDMGRAVSGVLEQWRSQWGNVFVGSADPVFTFASNAISAAGTVMSHFGLLPECLDPFLKALGIVKAKTTETLDSLKVKVNTSIPMMESTLTEAMRKAGVSTDLGTAGMFKSTDKALTNMGQSWSRYTSTVADMNSGLVKAASLDPVRDANAKSLLDMGKDMNSMKVLTMAQMDAMVKELGEEFRFLPADQQLDLFNQSAHIKWMKNSSDTMLVVGGITTGIGALFTAPAVIGAVGTLGAGISTKIGTWWDPISQKLVPLGGRIIDFFTNLKPEFGISMRMPNFAALASGFPATLSDAAFANLIGMSNKQFLPAFANGGFIDKEQIIRAGEGNKREAIIPLQNDAAMAPFAMSVAKIVSEVLSKTTNNKPANDKQPLYVGTLIADEKGYKMLERKLEVIRLYENGRKGL
jgi:hypothetical protein